VGDPDVIDESSNLALEARYEHDLRLWKLSGLSSAYLLAFAVNAGLFFAAAK